MPLSKRARDVSTEDDGLLSLDNQFCFALYAATRAVERAYGEALKALDLTYPQYLVMLVLWEWARADHHRPTVKALGNRLDTDSGTLTPLLKRMQEKGLVVRKRAVSTPQANVDEREVFVSVTPAGARLKRKARQIALQMLEQSPMPLDELIALREQLKRFRGRAAA
jgi:DNA-binding MarR family transcriptional regulator